MNDWSCPNSALAIRDHLSNRTRTMLPREDENRELILSHFADHFTVAKDLLNEVVATQSALMKAAESSSRPPVVVHLGLGFLAQSLRRFRSIVLLCEHGYLENAEILDRSLFETLLAVRFVLRKPKRISACSTELQGARRKLPPIPKKSQACEFRAALYIASEMVRFHRLGEDILQVPGNKRFLDSESRRRMQEAADEAERNIGPHWRRILQRGSFSGLSVKHLAECYGLQEHHRKLYGVQSTKVHAGGACDLLALILTA